MIGHNFRGHKVLRIFVTILVLVSFIANTISSYALPTGKQTLSTNKQTPTNKNEELFFNIKIPSSIGIISEVYRTNSPNHIVIIQDRHADELTQKNIAGMLDKLAGEYNLNLVCLENTSGVLDASFYDSYPNDAIKDKTSRFLLKKAVFTGPEFYRITHPDTKTKFIGVENRAIYLKHLDSFNKPRPQQKEALDFIAKIKSYIDKLKIHIYSRELIFLDKRIESYDLGNKKLAEFIEDLFQLSDKHKILLEDYTELLKFKELIKREKLIDFKKAESQRNQLIDKLPKILPEEELQQLLRESIDFKLNKTTEIEFYFYLLGIINKYRESLKSERISSLLAYCDYISSSSEIDAFKLFKQIEQLKENLKEALFKNQIQRLLSKIDRQLDILEDLIQLKLTPDNYAYYKENQHILAPEFYFKFLETSCPQYNIPLTIEKNYNIASIIKDAEEFYELANARDAYLAENALKLMQEKNAKAAALVAGGFHTKGITGLLKEKNISYTVILPRIGESRSESIYKARMAQQPLLKEEIQEILNFTIGAPLALGGADTNTRKNAEGAWRETHSLLKTASTKGEIQPGQEPSGAIGKWEFLTEPEFILENESTGEGFVKFRARHIETDKEEDIKIEARLATGEEESSIRIRMDNIFDKVRQPIIRNIINWYAVFRVIGERKPETFQGNLVILKDNKYGISGIGRKHLICLTEKRLKRDSAIIHEIGHSAICAGKISLEAIANALTPKSLQRVESKFKEKGRDRLKDHYLLRALLDQDQYLYIDNLLLSTNIKGEGWKKALLDWAYRNRAVRAVDGKLKANKLLRGAVIATVVTALLGTMAVFLGKRMAQDYEEERREQEQYTHEVVTQRKLPDRYREITFDSFDEALEYALSLHFGTIERNGCIYKRADGKWVFVVANIGDESSVPTAGVTEIKMEFLWHSHTTVEDSSGAAIVNPETRKPSFADIVISLKHENIPSDIIFVPMARAIELKKIEGEAAQPYEPFRKIFIELDKFAEEYTEKWGKAKGISRDSIQFVDYKSALFRELIIYVFEAYDYIFAREEYEAWPLDTWHIITELCGFDVGYYDGSPERETETRLKNHPKIKKALEDPSEHINRLEELKRIGVVEFLIKYGELRNKREQETPPSVETPITTEPLVPEGNLIGKLFRDKEAKQLVTSGITAKEENGFLVFYEGENILYTKDGNEARVRLTGETITLTATGQKIRIIEDNENIRGFADASGIQYIVPSLITRDTNQDIYQYHEKEESYYARHPEKLPTIEGRRISAHKLLIGGGKKTRRLLHQAIMSKRLKKFCKAEELIAYLRESLPAEGYTQEDIKREIDLIKYNAKEYKIVGKGLLYGKQDWKFTPRANEAFAAYLEETKTIKADGSATRAFLLAQNPSLEDQLYRLEVAAPLVGKKYGAKVEKLLEQWNDVKTTRLPNTFTQEVFNLLGNVPTGSVTVRLLQGKMPEVREWAYKILSMKELLSCSKDDATRIRSIATKIAQEWEEKEASIHIGDIVELRKAILREEAIEFLKKKEKIKHWSKLPLIGQRALIELLIRKVPGKDRLSQIASDQFRDVPVLDTGETIGELAEVYRYNVSSMIAVFGGDIIVEKTKEDIEKEAPELLKQKVIYWDSIMPAMKRYLIEKLIIVSPGKDSLLQLTGSNFDKTKLLKTKRTLGGLFKAYFMSTKAMLEALAKEGEKDIVVRKPDDVMEKDALKILRKAGTWPYVSLAMGQYLISSLLKATPGKNKLSQLTEFDFEHIKIKARGRPYSLYRIYKAYGKSISEMVKKFGDVTVEKTEEDIAKEAVQLLKDERYRDWPNIMREMKIYLIKLLIEHTPGVVRLSQLESFPETANILGIQTDLYKDMLESFGNITAMRNRFGDVDKDTPLTGRPSEGLLRHKGFGIEAKGDIASLNARKDAIKYAIKIYKDEERLKSEFGIIKTKATIAGKEIDLYLHQELVGTIGDTPETISKFLEAALNVRKDKKADILLGLRNKGYLIIDYFAGPKLFGNCENDDYIYVHPDFHLIEHSIFPNLKAVALALAVVGVAHELIHEAGIEINENELKRQDQELFYEQIPLFLTPGESFTEVTKQVTISLGLEDIDWRYIFASIEHKLERLHKEESLDIQDTAAGGKKTSAASSIPDKAKEPQKYAVLVEKGTPEVILALINNTIYAVTKTSEKFYENWKEWKGLAYIPESELDDKKGDGYILYLQGEAIKAFNKAAALYNDYGQGRGYDKYQQSSRLHDRVAALILNCVTNNLYLQGALVDKIRPELSDEKQALEQHLYETASDFATKIYRFFPPSLYEHLLSTESTDELAWSLAIRRIENIIARREKSAGKTSPGATEPLQIIEALKEGKSPEKIAMEIVRSSPEELKNYLQILEEEALYNKVWSASVYRILMILVYSQVINWDRAEEIFKKLRKDLPADLSIFDKETIDDLRGLKEYFLGKIGHNPRVLKVHAGADAFSTFMATDAEEVLMYADEPFGRVTGALADTESKMDYWNHYREKFWDYTDCTDFLKGVIMPLLWHLEMLGVPKDKVKIKNARSKDGTAIKDVWKISFKWAYPGEREEKQRTIHYITNLNTLTIDKIFTPGAKLSGRLQFLKSCLEKGVDIYIQKAAGVAQDTNEERVYSILNKLRMLLGPGKHCLGDFELFRNMDVGSFAAIKNLPATDRLKFGYGEAVLLERLHVAKTSPGSTRVLPETIMHTIRFEAHPTDKYSHQASINVNEILNAIGAKRAYENIVVNLGSGANPLTRIELIEDVINVDDVVYEDAKPDIQADFLARDFLRKLREKIGDKNVAATVLYNLWTYLILYTPEKIAKFALFPEEKVRYCLDVIWDNCIEDNGYFVFVNYMPPEGDVSSQYIISKAEDIMNNLLQGKLSSSASEIHRIVDETTGEAVAVVYKKSAAIKTSAAQTGLSIEKLKGEIGKILSLPYVDYNLTKISRLLEKEGPEYAVVITEAMLMNPLFSTQKLEELVKNEKVIVLLDVGEENKDLIIKENLERFNLKTVDEFLIEQGCGQKVGQKAVEKEKALPKTRVERLEAIKKYIPVLGIATTTEDMQALKGALKDVYICSQKSYEREGLKILSLDAILVRLCSVMSAREPMNTQTQSWWDELPPIDDNLVQEIIRIIEENRTSWQALQEAA